MIISLNWLRDFVDLPRDLNPRDMGLRFTMTTAEVESVEHHEANVRGLIAAKIESIERIEDEGSLKRVGLSAGKRFSTLSAAPNLSVGDIVIYGPPGAAVEGHVLGETDPAGRPSQGMILAGQGLGLVQVGANAIFLPPNVAPGSLIDAALFDDWLIEVDNKSITHRPDLWGHYGIAREVAAILDLPLKRYDVTDVAKLRNPSLPVIPIEIDDPALAPRYTGLLMKGLRSQPAPLWMQVRLAMIGMRPIDLLVDLTNYVMADLGQPMHAFDAAKMNNIQVAVAAPRERFTTLDGVTRELPPGTLMIQCNRKSVAIAGIMGGAETEVSKTTDTILLESANFEAPTIRKAATAMGHRTEASARFEKSLDPVNTVLGIARFHKLAVAEIPTLQLASTLSDCYPRPQTPSPIEMDCDFTARFIGKAVTADQIEKILTRIEFKCERIGSEGSRVRGFSLNPSIPQSLNPSAPSSPQHLNPQTMSPPLLRVTPPSFRATKDIEIEADLIEEVSRFVGYDNIAPSLPTVAARHLEPSADLQLEVRTLDYLCVGGDFCEVHDYIWYDDDWVKTLGYNPGDCITLQNPAAANCSRLRHSLVPGLISATDRNRRHYERFQLAEIGSVFHVGTSGVENSQGRHLGLVVAQTGKKADGAAWDTLRSAIIGWSRQVLESEATFEKTAPRHPWEDPQRIAEVQVNRQPIGRVTILPLACKLKIDERLRAWSIVVAELQLGPVAHLLGRHDKLPVVPRFPQVALDFSALANSSLHYRNVCDQLAAFRHALLRRLSFVGAYEGASIPEGKRSLTFRAEIGADDRTLSDADTSDFQSAFKDFLGARGMELRS